MKDDSGMALTQLLKGNNKMTKINVDNNMLSHKYIEEIQNACERNWMIQKKNAMPKF